MKSVGELEQLERDQKHILEMRKYTFSVTAALLVLGTVGALVYFFILPAARDQISSGAYRRWSSQSGLSVLIGFGGGGLVGFGALLYQIQLQMIRSEMKALRKKKSDTANL